LKIFGKRRGVGRRKAFFPKRFPPPHKNFH